MLQLLAVGRGWPKVGGRSGELFGRIDAPICGPWLEKPFPENGGPTWVVVGPKDGPLVDGHGADGLPGGNVGVPVEVGAFQGLKLLGGTVLWARLF